MDADPGLLLEHASAGLVLLDPADGGAVAGLVAELSPLLTGPAAGPVAEALALLSLSAPERAGSMPRIAAALDAAGARLAMSPAGPRIAGDDPLLEEFLGRARVAIVALRQQVRAWQAGGPLPAGLRSAIHTLKGEAGVLDLRAVALDLHAVEAELGLGAPRTAQIPSVHASPAVEAVRRKLAESSDPGTPSPSLAGFQDILATGERSAAESVLAALDRCAVAFGSAVGGARPAWPPTMRALLDRGARIARSTALQLGREVVVSMQGDDSELAQDLSERLATALLHLVRNAVGHGIEAPQERLAVGKPAAGALSLSGIVHRGTLELTVTDDGRGIDRVAVLAKARGLGLVGPEALAGSAFDELLFHPGLSTASAASLVSGRGLGLEAARAAVQGAGGTITFASRPGAGTTATMYLPLHVTRPEHP